MPTQITRLVVLMLENRSFDHMLGFLKRSNPAIDGLRGDEWNYPIDDAEPNVVVSDNAGDVHDLDPDPGHAFQDVTSQIFSNQDPSTPADMRGFVRNYHHIAGDPKRAANVMKCFSPATLPVLSTLATQYAVCDRWFSSVPGSTIPNRLFVHGASSGGSLTQDAIMAPYLLHTIYESMGRNTPYDYRIYTSGASVLLANRYLSQHPSQFSLYTNFVGDARRGDLPAYTFIEPAYDDDPDNGLYANSQHPDFPVDRGEALISEIYYALTKSPDWKSTLFLILYDEHGGIYDHVVPPVLVRDPLSGTPDVPASKPPDVFDFTRLGVRVPAVFISPCIPPNTVLNTRDYEHASVVATVRKLFCPGTPPLTWREAQAPTFDDVLTLTGDNIRTDVVDLPDPIVSPGVLATVGAAAADAPRRPTDLSVLMARAMQHSLQQRGIAPPGDASQLSTAKDTMRYLHQTQALSRAAVVAR